ncbi:MAG: Uncharacterised protein [Rhodospirillaceae bacterium]|jgi:hypothetical protein|nr:MAG: Uncharacterised protein [Rhodospirillaceae bacterium]
MKKFALICENEHEFEGWFASSDAVLLQSKKGLIDCPYCGSVNVEKQLAAPNLSTPKTKARQQADMANLAGAEETPAPPTQAPTQVPAPASTSTQVPAPTPAPAPAMQAGAPSGGQAAAAYHSALRYAVQQLRKTIETDFTNVGANFAEKAREIHYGEAEEANIYGTCTKEETEELLDEGVEIMPLPDLPPDH